MSYAHQKMLREKIIEKFLSFIFSIPESEKITQTVVSHVLRTRWIQRASCEMLFCIRGIGFGLQKGWWLAGQSVGTGITWRHLTRGFWAGLSVPLGLCPSEKPHADSLTPVLLMETVPLPWERVCRHGSPVNKARVQTFCWAERWVFHLAATHNKTMLFPLKTKPASLCNVLSFLPNLFWLPDSSLAWPKDVKRNLWEKKGIQIHHKVCKLVLLCCLCLLRKWKRRLKSQACCSQFSLKDELNSSGWNYIQVKLSQIHVEIYPII